MKNESDQAGFWEQHMKAATAFSGSARAYCREAGVASSSFYFWRRKLSEQAVRPKALSSFLPVVVSKPPETRGRELPDASWVAKVLIEVSRGVHESA